MPLQLARLVPSLAGIALVLLVFGLASHAPAQQAKPSKRLADEEPFDRITLDEENQGAVIKVEPLELPGRKMPANPNPDDSLKIKLYAQPDKTYSVLWRHIKKIEFFEEMLLAEAQRHLSENRLDEAYDALQNLHSNFPKAAGVEEALQLYLYTSAGRLFQEQRWSEALVALEELHRRNKDYQQGARTLGQVMSAVLDKLISGYVERADYRSARLLLARVKRDYGEQQQGVVGPWEERIKTAAAKERDAAQAFIAAGKLREANLALRKMSQIWPDLEGSAALVAEVSAKYPIVVVGVTQPALALDVLRLDDWAARRAGKATTVRLLEFQRPGPEGGQYAFDQGTWNLSEDRRKIALQLASPESGPAKVTGYDLAERLLAIADPRAPDFSPTWASIVKSVSVRDVMRVDVELKLPYVAPQAALQLPWLQNDPLAAALRRLPAEGDETSLVATRRKDGAGLAEVTERRFDDSATQILALRRGEIDVIDRVFPADVKQLEGDPSVRIGKYALPTLHFLVPHPTRPWAQNRTLRRALLYGIDRQAILNEQLLAGAKWEGARLLAGPFSPGMAENDPLAYAYDPLVAPRPYEPRLAATLLALAQREAAPQGEKKNTGPAPPPPSLQITLGHSQAETARVACESIAEQLEALGLACKLVALPPGETRDTADACDFVYAEVTLAEPVVDARRLLDAAGIVRSRDPYVQLALRRIDQSANWPDARERLRELHRLVAADVTVLPLWQLPEHYAYRPALAGLEASSVWLYENVEQWQLKP